MHEKDLSAGLTNKLAQSLMNAYEGPKVSDYEISVLQTLLCFQKLEEALKHYLLRTEIIICNGVGNRFVYKIPLEELWNLPLGKLHNRFSARSPDTHLAARISELIKDRNEIAHKSLLKAGAKLKTEVLTNFSKSLWISKLKQKVEGLPVEVDAATEKLENDHPEIFAQFRKHALAVLKIPAKDRPTPT